MNLTQGFLLLNQLPAAVEGLPEGQDLAWYLSDYALQFVPGKDQQRPTHTNGQPDFWLFLPFATAADFPNCSSRQTLELALASTYMIIYSFLFDTVVDDPGSPEITTQVLAEAALAKLHERLYHLFPAGSPFWGYFQPCFERFLASMVEEKTLHKNRPQAYTYEDFTRLAREKMSMVLMNPIGQAVLDGTSGRIPGLLAAWDGLNVAVIIIDDIKDWEDDYQQGNYTYLLAEALHLGENDQLMPDGEGLVTQVVFSGVMEELYRQGAAQLDRAVDAARRASAPALAGLAEERAAMFRKFGRHLFQRKLAGLTNQLGKPVTHPVQG